MQTLTSKIDIYYDGTNVEKYSKLPYVVGFTTNTSFMAQANELDYASFYAKHVANVNGRPISLQLYSDDDGEMVQDAHKIAEYGTNVFVKIPVQKANGTLNLPVVRHLLQQGIKVNITAIFTTQQLKEVYRMLCDVSTNTPVIVSIFAGRISDTGVDPSPIVTFGCKLLEDMKHVQVLWAGCKEVLSIQHAIHAGCHIITIPDGIMDRMNRLYKDLDEFSKETVASFQKDAVDKNILI